MRGFQPGSMRGKAKPFANGGPVRGPGTGTSDDVSDNVPSGTYIMPADSTQAVGEQQLAAMGSDAKGVPVQLSNGEYKLPPEQVHAIGVQALDQIKGATHTPVAARGFAPGAQQQAEPPLFFVDGGLVGSKREDYMGNAFKAMEQQRADSAAAGQAAAASAQEASEAAAARARTGGASGLAVDTSPENAARFAQVPTSIGQQPAPAATPTQAPQGMTDAQRAQSIGQIPTGGLAAPPTAGAAPVPAPAVPATAPTAAGFMPGTRAVFNESGKAIGDLASQGRYGAAAGEAARAALAYAPAVADDVIGGAARAVLPAVVDAGKQFLGMGSTPAVPPPAASTAVARPGASPTAPVAAGSPAAVAERGAANPAPGDPGTPVPASTTPAATQIAPGIFRSGNSYSDSADGAIAGAVPRGLPSARDVAAADALAARSQQESIGRVMTAQQPGTVTAPTVLHSGNSWQARNDLRNLEVSASSITNRPEWQSGSSTQAWSTRGPTAKGDPQGKIAAYQSALAADIAARGLQPSMDAAAMRENAGLQREGMQQQGESARAAMREQGESTRAGARSAIDAGRLNLEKQVRGFDIRQGERQEKLNQRYEAAKTPEERAAIAQQIRDLSGKQAESPWKIQVTPATKNADGSTSEGSIYRYNTQTGQVVRADTGAAEAKPTGMPKLGDMRNGYRYKGGNPNDQANWEKV
ncbi:hypothetical protein [Alicycliphilus denitrificans]|uniref:hypothetical protein n=1 Tax=Alicycliphilus denitrificans TaxID=179636 RepID=UPI0011AF2060|nr:hypothetical protein [Alicycliphilus denitrificans]